ncbi:MAG TPA: hypothetical protein VII06_07290 [Chloroflexota bacterium]|jgi:hypothetical protein
MPLGIRVLGFLMLIGGLFSLVWGAALSTLGGASWLTGLVFSDSIQAWGGSAVASGLWTLLVGVVQIITAIGLFARKRWAWFIALVITVFALITPVVGLMHGNVWSVFGLIIPGLIFFYLIRDQDVRRAFRLA